MDWQEWASPLLYKACPPLKIWTLSRLVVLVPLFLNPPRLPLFFQIPRCLPGSNLDMWAAGRTHQVLIPETKKKWGKITFSHTCSHYYDNLPCSTHTEKLSLTHRPLWSLIGLMRNGSTIQTTFCFCRGSQFCSQAPMSGMSQAHITPFPGNPMSLFAFIGSAHRWPTCTFFIQYVFITIYHIINICHNYNFIVINV